jgi:Peptidase C39 family
MDTANNDSGLRCLSLLLRFHQVAVDPGQIAHQFAGASIGVQEMLRCAKDMKLKARAVATDWAGLMKLPLPAIAELKDKTFLIVGKITADEALVQVPSEGRPQVIKRAEFEYDWTGRVVLMARRASLSDLARRFDITWFLQAMYKYRRLLGEVLLASFFLQLFALVTPLFFQVVTDKVLTHREPGSDGHCSLGFCQHCCRFPRPPMNHCRATLIHISCPLRNPVQPAASLARMLFTRRWYNPVNTLLSFMDERRSSWPRFPAGTSPENGSTIAAALLRAPAPSLRPRTTASASRCCSGTSDTAITARSISTV